MDFIASLDKRRVATALIALLLAFGSGFVMQNFLVGGDSVATIQDAPDAAPLLERSDGPEDLPVPPAATLVPIQLQPPILPDRTREAFDIWEVTITDPCRVLLEVRPMPAAMLKLRYQAPCGGIQQVSVRHDELRFDVRTDLEGQLVLNIPAVNRDAEVYLTIGDETLVAVADVPEASEFARVGLSWQGKQMLELHAFEFGAVRNQFGHVWSGAPKSVDRAARGAGGFLQRLGDGSGQTAMIYSFPTYQSALRGVVRLSVEAEVTSAICGRKIKATALQGGVFGRLSTTDVNLEMPKCDEIGETVVLKNLLHDMRMAAR